VDGFTGPGNCNGCPPLAAAQLGTHLLCIPTLSPAPCPQPCPVDPASAAATLVLPMPGGEAFRSTLYVLGLVDGLTVSTATLGRPTACGALFANNYCAVAGV